MKALLFLLIGSVASVGAGGVAADAPRGTLLELHSCEVFAGGCVVSSEAPQSGGYMLRAWNFTGGKFAGTDLKGLRLAVLQVSADNLATPDTTSGDAVIYLPEAATTAERNALVAWLNSSQTDFHPARTETRVAPLQFESRGGAYTFSAGNRIAVKTSPMQRCEVFTCGEELWYQPRAFTSVFTVAVDRDSRISEPLLKLTWNDEGKRNVFLARFGEPGVTKNQYVSLDEVCGQGNTLF